MPAKDFWSIVVYDPQTRSELQTGQPFPGRNNKRDADWIVNADGSVDLFFGPTPPVGKENNWLQTVPSKNWFAILRLYGPLEPWFDKTWRPGDIVEIPSHRHGLHERTSLHPLRAPGSDSRRSRRVVTSRHLAADLV